MFRAIQYLKYLLTAGNAHGLHSPFVYTLYTNVIRDETPFYAFDIAESIRAKMLLSEDKIEVEDYGTGGIEIHKKELSLRYIAGHYLKSKKYSQLLFRLVNHFQPQNILELGTSLGITTIYLASPNKQSRILTLEGSSETADVALKNFEKAGMKNIEVVIGEFDKTLVNSIPRWRGQGVDVLDFVYFDGNHRKEPTLKYFNSLLPYHHENSVFVFDDIYWSRGMKQAWEEIKAHPDVTITIDLFSIGLVFFKKDLKKQHFRLRF